MKHRKDAGNALWFILIAIALLGFLSALMMRTGSQTDETGDAERVTIQASAMMRYVAGLKTAIDGMKSRGCSENQISFWTDLNGDGIENASDTYYNPRAPLDKSCHVFDVKGGGMTLQSPPAVNGNTFEYIFSGDNGIYGAGTSGNVDMTGWDVSHMDLIVALPITSSALCTAINRSLNLPTDNLAIDRLVVTNLTFVGNYTIGNALPDDGGNRTPFLFKMSACIQSEAGQFPRTAGANNFFYSLLMSR